MFFINYKVKELIYINMKAEGLFKLDELADISGLLEKNQPMSSSSEQSASEIDETLASFEEIMNLSKEEFADAEKKAAKEDNHMNIDEFH